MIIPGYPLTGRSLLKRLATLSPCSIEDAALQCGYAHFTRGQRYPQPDVLGFQAALTSLTQSALSAA